MKRTIFFLIIVAIFFFTTLREYILINSFLTLHYAFGLFKDTARRYDRMCYYGNNSKYDVENFIVSNYWIKYTRSFIGYEHPEDATNPIYRNKSISLAFISSVFLSLLPLFAIFDWKWYMLIPINLLFSMLVSPMIAFLTIPPLTIYSKYRLTISTIIYSIIGVALYGISFLFT